MLSKFWKHTIKGEEVTPEMGLQRELLGGLLEGHGQGAGDARVDARRSAYAYVELGFGEGNALVLIDYLG